MAAGCGTHRSARRTTEATPADDGRAGSQESQNGDDEGTVAGEAASDLAGTTRAPLQRLDERAPRPPGRLVAGEATRAAASDKRIVTGTVRVVVADVAVAVSAIGQEAARVGGSVAREIFSRGDHSANGQIRLRLPPEAVVPFLQWLETQGKIESRDMEAEDVSLKYFDQELAIHNLQITMERLQQLVSRPSGELKDVLEIERELTRVRGQIEELKGEHRFLADRIGRATLQILLATKPGMFIPPPQEPELKFQIVPRALLLGFVDARDREQVRPGGGVSVMFSRSFAFELEVFPRRGPGARSWLFSMTGGGYSDFLGRGQRQFLNPYLGLRLGGGSFDDRRLISVGADVGLELFRHRLFFAELNARAIWFIYFGDASPRTDPAGEGTLAVGIPF